MNRKLVGETKREIEEEGESEILRDIIIVIYNSEGLERGTETKKVSACISLQTPEAETVPA